jgi:hypothetical protein
VLQVRLEDSNHTSPNPLMAGGKSRGTPKGPTKD